MKEHRPKKLLDQVRACPELGEGMPSASNTIPSDDLHPLAPSKPKSAGARGIPSESSATPKVHDLRDPSDRGAAEVEALRTGWVLN